MFIFYRKFHGYDSLKEYYEKDSCVHYIHNVSISASLYGFIRPVSLAKHLSTKYAVELPFYLFFDLFFKIISCGAYSARISCLQQQSYGSGADASLPFEIIFLPCLNLVGIDSSVNKHLENVLCCVIPCCVFTVASYNRRHNEA